MCVGVHVRMCECRWSQNPEEDVIFSGIMAGWEPHNVCAVTCTGITGKSGVRSKSLADETSLQV